MPAPAPVAAAPAPVVVAAPVAAVRSLAVKSSKLQVDLGCSGAACLGKVQVSTSGRYKVGKTMKTVALTKAVSYSVAANGSAKVMVSLTGDGKRLLKRVKKLSVTVTVTPATGSKFTRKLTLKA